jgi:proline iminopeptidase
MEGMQKEVSMKWWHCLFVLALIGLAGGCVPDSQESQQLEALAGLENGSFTAQLNGFNIHYEVHGQGPVVMTVPNSWGLSLAGLRAVYRPLEERLTMVYFDPRGMGESDPVQEETDMGMAAVRADFDALRRHLGLEAVHAIGWSNGAMNLILLAAEYPDKLSSAIFLHGAASFTEEDNQVWATRFPDLTQRYEVFMQEMTDEAMPIEEKTARQRELWLEHVFPVMFADPEAAKSKLKEIYAETEFSWPHADYANRETPVFDVRDKLAAITTRCLVLAGAHDMMPPEKIQELHDGLTDSKFVVFEDSGHFAPVEEPEAFKTLVYDFLGIQ